MQIDLERTERKVEAALRALMAIVSTLEQPVQRSSTGGPAARILRGDAECARKLAEQTIAKIEKERTEGEIRCAAAISINDSLALDIPVIYRAPGYVDKTVKALTDIANMHRMRHIVSTQPAHNDGTRVTAFESTGNRELWSVIVQP